jgi:3-phosphoglycerate kinase
VPIPVDVVVAKEFKADAPAMLNAGLAAIAKYGIEKDVGYISTGGGQGAAGLFEVF